MAEQRSGTGDGLLAAVYPAPRGNADGEDRVDAPAAVSAAEPPLRCRSEDSSGAARAAMRPVIGAAGDEGSGEADEGLDAAAPGTRSKRSTPA